VMTYGRSHYIVVSLAALVDTRDAAGWNISSEMPYWIVCLLIAAWAAWGLWLIMTEPQPEQQGEQLENSI